MKMLLRTTVVIGVCVLSGGVSACGTSDPKNASTNKVTRHDAPTTGDKQPHRSVSDFAGTWTYAPTQPSETTTMTFDTKGNITVEASMANPAWKGTITRAAGGSFTVTLLSQDQEQHRWVLILAPTGDKNTMTVITEGQQGTLIRVT